MSKTHDPCIRPANDDDLPIIRRWLDDHLRAGVSETLEVNWPITLEVYSERGMLVYECPTTFEPIAYFWGTLNTTSSILEVKSDQRGNGVGRKLVEHLLKTSIKNRETLLLIECAPESSAPFWRAMGFTVGARGHSRNPVAWQILRMPLRLPKDSEPAEVVIRFLPEKALYETAPALIEHRPRAVKCKDGTIRLGERLAHYEPVTFNQFGDLAVEVVVDGVQLYRGKAKREEAANRGFIRCKNGYAIERICAIT